MADCLVERESAAQRTSLRIFSKPQRPMKSVIDIGSTDNEFPKQIIHREHYDKAIKSERVYDRFFEDQKPWYQVREKSPAQNPTMYDRDYTKIQKQEFTRSKSTSNIKVEHKKNNIKQYDQIRVKDIANTERKDKNLFNLGKEQQVKNNSGYHPVTGEPRSFSWKGRYCFKNRFIRVQDNPRVQYTN